jgi:SAM-dependent methyltransferase
LSGYVGKAFATLAATGCVYLDAAYMTASHRRDLRQYAADFAAQPQPRIGPCKCLTRPPKRAMSSNETEPGGPDLPSLAADAGEPWTPDCPYFALAEPHGARLWHTLIKPFLQGCDFTAVLDLAAGHGRNSVFLQPIADYLTIMDIQAENVEICRARFGDAPNVRYIVNNGYDFRPVANESLTLIYCFDAMVHFDSDIVRSYLRDTGRVLQPTGRGFFHHSNYTGGHNWRSNPHARNFMSKELFEHYALKEGLRIVRQKIIDWDDIVGHDCLTLLERPVE